MIETNPMAVTELSVEEAVRVQGGDGLGETLTLIGDAAAAAALWAARKAAELGQFLP